MTVLPSHAPKAISWSISTARSRACTKVIHKVGPIIVPILSFPFPLILLSLLFLSSSLSFFAAAS